MTNHNHYPPVPPFFCRFQNFNLGFLSFCQTREYGFTDIHGSFLSLLERVFGVTLSTILKKNALCSNISPSMYLPVRYHRISDASIKRHSSDLSLFSELISSKFLVTAGRRTVTIENIRSIKRFKAIQLPLPVCRAVLNGRFACHWKIIQSIEHERNDQ